MAKSKNENNRAMVSRRSLLKGSAAGVAAAAVGLAAPEIAEARRRKLIIEVENAGFTPGSGDVNNFIVIGDIVTVNGHNATGKFFCKGVLFTGTENGTNPDAGTYVDQRFRIDGVGSILGAGAEFDGIGEHMAVVGGTGRWAGARGTYVADGGPPNITFEFNIRPR